MFVYTLDQASIFKSWRRVCQLPMWIRCGSGFGAQMTFHQFQVLLRRVDHHHFVGLGGGQGGAFEHPQFIGSNRSLPVLVVQ